MVFKCCIFKCRSNYAGEESTTVFSFPKDEDLKRRWVKFVNRKDWQPTSSSFICSKHFEPKYYKKGATDKRCRLIKKLKPVPSIFDPENTLSSSSSTINLTSPILVPRRSPRKRDYQEDQYDDFLADDLIRGFNDLNESLSPPSYSFKLNNDHAIFFKLIDNVSFVPEVTDCIMVDKEMHVKLFYKGAPLPLPQWFRQHRDCTLTRKSML